MTSAVWPRQPLRRLGAIVSGGTPTPDATNWDGAIPFVTPPDLRPVTGGVVAQTERTITEAGAKSGSSIVPANSVLLSIRAPIGYVARTVAPAAFNQGCRALVPGKAIDSRYVVYALLTGGSELEANGRGTTFTELSGSQMSSFEIPVPPAASQRAIADYLDRETAQIDTLIAKQEQLIATLRERRRAVITDLATGLDRDDLVDSGDSFFGAVPSGWKRSRFGHVIEINGGQVDPREEPWASMILVAPNHIESGGGRIVGRETAHAQGADSGKYVAHAGQVIYSKIRPALNKVAIAEEDCLISADMYAISSRVGDNHKYLMYQMLSHPFRMFATVTSLRVKMPKINREELAEARILRPSFAEQLAIVERIENQTSKIDTLIAKAEQFIALSKERRSALITAAVTGQIDVTGKAA